MGTFMRRRLLWPWPIIHATHKSRWIILSVTCSPLRYIKHVLNTCQHSLTCTRPPLMLFLLGSAKSPAGHAGSLARSSSRVCLFRILLTLTTIHLPAAAILKRLSDRGHGRAPRDAWDYSPLGPAALRHSPRGVEGSSG